MAIAWLLLTALPNIGRTQKLSPLADAPDWRKLEAYQETITREDFTRLLEKVYAPHGGWQPFFRVDADQVIIRKSNIPLDDLFTLRFAPPVGEATRPLPKTYWRFRAIMPPAVPGQPLAGVRVALDPGHLGGRWAKLEERWFQINDSAPVTEGDMTLHVAEKLAARLRALGAADVQLVRHNDEPSTSQRPEQLETDAWKAFLDQGNYNPRTTSGGPEDPQRTASLPWMSDVLFTRADIRARGRLVNETLHPDLVVCLHFNAEAWGNPAKPTLVDKNHLHVMINGCYGPDEIERDDVRFEMLIKLLDRSYSEEKAVAESVAPALAQATGLPSYQYTNDHALRVGASPYIWARNLLANRIYQCPTVYLEPYVMNSPEVFARVQAGDYEGTREFGGVERKSIIREYADAVAEGLAAYYQTR